MELMRKKKSCRRRGEISKLNGTTNKTRCPPDKCCIDINYKPWLSRKLLSSRIAAAAKHSGIDELYNICRI